MKLLSILLFACSGSSPEPAPATEAPRRPETPKPVQMRAPIEAPVVVEAQIDLAKADPMAIVAEKGPGGVPAPAISLLFASRGDGEIEPCG